MRDCRTFLPLLLLLSVAVPLNASAADWLVPQSTGTKASFRGLAVRSAKEVWVTGSGGTVLRSTDAGTTWKAVAPPDSAELDFRDLALPAPQHVVLMSAGPGDNSRIFLSNDNGASWHSILTNPSPDGFFDAMTFADAETGFLIGDPIDGHADLYRTDDGGATWDHLRGPKLKEGEYFFAASGSNIAALSKNELRVVTGGAMARVWNSSDGGKTWTANKTPITHGNESTGIFSVAWRDAKHAVVVGGDYQNPQRDLGNVAFTIDGKTWTLSKPTGAKTIPHKACVKHIAGSNWMCAGRTGIAISSDDGATWRSVSKDSFYTVDVVPNSKFGWLAGSDGRVAKFRYPQ